MLRKIILCLTQSYEESIIHTQEYDSFLEEMKSHNVLVERNDFFKIRDTAVIKEEILYLSDDEKILAFLQEQGCYTIAVYHDGVNSMLSGTKFAMEGLDGVEWEHLEQIYQRFMGQPWEITQTRRCTVREMCEEDLEELYELYSSPLITRYMEGLSEDREQEKQYIKDYIENVYAYYGFGTWLIHRKEDGVLIGRAGFNYRPGFDEVELGFVIGEPYWRSGYAYEVCAHLMDMGKMVYGFGKVQALVKKENEASIHLLQKLGFNYAENIHLDGEEYLRYLS